MNDSLHIIHLSDLHINPAEEGESRPVFESLCKRIEKFRYEKGVGIDLLIISGDLVNQGAEDYSPVKRRLDEIISASGLPIDRVFIVPGNHDVAWERCTGSHRAVVELLKRNPKELERMDADMKKSMLPGFEAYLNFAEEFPLLRQGTLGLPGFAQADLTISGIPIRLCGLNSALVAGPPDHGKRDRQLTDRVAGLRLLWHMLGSGKQLNLVVSHYPLSWIQQDERQEVIERLQRYSAIFFHGHIHEAETGISGVQQAAQLLVLGVGSLYGQKWHGRNHCQILEMNFSISSPLLHEWFWFGKYGWRSFEPIEIAWSPWRQWCQQFSRPITPAPDLTMKCKEVGLTNIGNRRRDFERTAYFQRVLDSVAESTELIIVGRSLTDWSLLFESIESTIKEKKIHVKLALLDENSLPDKNAKPDSDGNKSWIEKPIATDWAMSDVPASMARFRRIKVEPKTGSLEIFGLPIYVSYSFVAYTNRHDNARYCLKEAGMALGKESRPFVEFKAVSHDSYACSLEWMYKSLMTEERLLLADDGQRRERDTTRREKILVSKVKELGLVDLTVGRKSIDWPAAGKGVANIIEQTPMNGEIFIVGRSLVGWVAHLAYQKLARAIVHKGVRCTFVIANPEDPDLKSLVKEDYAASDLKQVWSILNRDMGTAFKAIVEKQDIRPDQVGYFEVYGIPAYVPVTFASYTTEGGMKYCSLEVGIGVTPEERTILMFQNVSEKDIFSSLYGIYRGIIRDRTPLLRIPKKT